MIELLLGAGVCVLAAKIADADEESSLLWGGVAALLCFLGVYFAFTPFLRMLAAGVLTFIFMIAFKMVRDR